MKKKSKRWWWECSHIVHINLYSGLFYDSASLLSPKNAPDFFLCCFFLNSTALTFCLYNKCVLLGSFFYERQPMKEPTKNLFRVPCVTIIFFLRHFFSPFINVRFMFFTLLLNFIWIDHIAVVLHFPLHLKAA